MSAAPSSTLNTPPADPFELFDAWYVDAARDERIKYAAAVCLSTTDLDGFPDARTVLLKLYDAAGFVFFTDCESAKGRSLLRFPHAALTFYWGPLDRQIRTRGSVELAAEKISDECFSRRPRGSQITAWASKQSRVLERPSDLERRIASFSRKFAGEDPVPRPANWRAYRLNPRAIEFWSARSNRLHDRLLYTRITDGSWSTSRLYP